MLAIGLKLASMFNVYITRSPTHWTHSPFRHWGSQRTCWQELPA